MTENVFGISIEDDFIKMNDFAVDTNIKSLVLHRWQQECVYNFFNSDCKLMVEVATGAGKTILACQIIKEVYNLYPDTRTLIVVPKNVIMESGWYKELYNYGFSLVDIGVYYGNIKELGRITITNVQNLGKIDLSKFNFLILDEAHNMATERIFNILENNRDLLEMDRFKFRLGLSATMERPDNKFLRLFRFFNYNSYKYSPKEALQEGILNDFDFYDIDVIMDEATKLKYDDLTFAIQKIVNEGGGHRSIMKKNNPLKNTYLKLLNERSQLVNNYDGKLEVCKWIVNRHKECKIIIFNQFNSVALKYYYNLLDLNIKVKIIHSGINREINDKTLIDFSLDKFSCLISTRMLDEGYNLPKLDVAVIMAGDSTAKQTIQRLGRVLRKKDKNSVLYLVGCKDTIEDKYNIEKRKLFKELCSYYNKFVFDNGILQ